MFHVVTNLVPSFVAPMHEKLCFYHHLSKHIKRYIQTKGPKLKKVTTTKPFTKIENSLKNLKTNTNILTTTVASNFVKSGNQM